MTSTDIERVVSPAQQIPPKTGIPTIREPQFPEPQAPPQSPPAFKPQATPSFTPVQPPASHQEPPVKRSGNSFYLRKARQESVSRPGKRKGDADGCHCVIC